MYIEHVVQCLYVTSHLIGGYCYTVLYYCK